MNSSKYSKLWEVLGAATLILSLGASIYLVFFANQESVVESISGVEAGWQFAVIFLLAFLASAAAPASTSFLIYALIRFWNWEIILAGQIAGAVLGYIFAFWLARTYKYKLLEWLPWLNKLDEWEQQLTKNSGYTNLFFFRLITLPVGDYLSYLAGLTSISFKKFMIVSILASLIWQTFVTYSISVGFASGGSVLPVVIFVIVSGLMWLAYNLYKQRQAPQP